MYVYIYIYLYNGVEINRFELSRLADLEHERPERSLSRGRIRHGNAGITMTKRGQLAISSGHIALAVEREHRAAVERAVVFRIIHPTLGVMRIHAAKSQSDDMTGRVHQTTSQVSSTRPGQRHVQGQRGDELVVVDGVAVVEGHRLLSCVDAYDL